MALCKGDTRPLPRGQREARPEDGKPDCGMKTAPRRGESGSAVWGLKRRSHTRAQRRPVPQSDEGEPTVSGAEGGEEAPGTKTGQQGPRVTCTAQAGGRPPPRGLFSEQNQAGQRHGREQAGAGSWGVRPGCSRCPSGYLPGGPGGHCRPSRQHRGLSAVADTGRAPPPATHVLPCRQHPSIAVGPEAPAEEHAGRLRPVAQ